MDKYTSSCWQHNKIYLHTRMYILIYKDTINNAYHIIYSLHIGENPTPFCNDHFKSHILITNESYHITLLGQYYEIICHLFYVPCILYEKNNPTIITNQYFNVYLFLNSILVSIIMEHILPKHFWCAMHSPLWTNPIDIIYH